MSQQIKRFYEFDNFRIDLTERALLREGEFVPLTQKAFEVLLALVEGRGGIVSKEELMEKVWPIAAGLPTSGRPTSWRSAKCARRWRTD